MSIYPAYDTGTLMNIGGALVKCIIDPGIFELYNNTYNIRFFLSCTVVYLDTRNYGSDVKTQYYTAHLIYNVITGGWWNSKCIMRAGVPQVDGVTAAGIAAGQETWLSYLDTMFPSSTGIKYIGHEDGVVFPTYILEAYTSFHSDPVYVEATKLKYTDGTYNFIRGAADSERARKAAYNSLLKSYGTFYKGTEKELAECFANTIDQSSS